MKSKFSNILLAKPLFYILALISFAIIFRMLRFDDFATFGHDNSRDNIVSFKMFEYGEYIYVGPVFSVIWGYMSPIYYYMLYPFYLLMNFHPLSAAVASMVANISALVLGAYVSFKFFGKAAAFITTVLFGFSVYVVLQGGEGLNPSLMLPFSVLGFYSYVEWLKTSKPKFMYLFAFALSFITALHPAGFFLLVPFIVLFFIYRPKFSLKDLIISGGIYGLLGVLPYLIQEKKLAWWTFKQFIEYFKSGSEVEIGISQLFINYWTAVLKNISLTLFNDTGQIGLAVAVIIMAFMLYEAIKFTRCTDRHHSEILAFTLILYLITFGLAVKFDSSEPHAKWFAAAFIPLLVLYISSLLTRLYRTNYWFASLFILLGFFLINFQILFTLNRQTDSFSYMKQVSEIIRENSSGETIDIYGLNPEPVYYLMWYYEEDPELKEKYFTWIKWAKEKDDDVVYFVQTKYALDENTIEKITDVHGTETQEEIFTSETGNKIYVFR